MAAEEMLSFKWEWESAPGVKVHEHRATWARLGMTVGDEAVTLVNDLDSGSSRRSIYVPLYPLAEWIAYHWWLLLYNSRLSRPDSTKVSDRIRLLDPLWKRHNFRSVGDGFAWPDFAIVPAGEHTHLIWRPYSSPVAGWKIRYITSGEYPVNSGELREELSRFIEAVIARLDECNIKETPLHKEWSEIQRTDADEAAYCRAAARLGLDPYTEASQYEDVILRSAELVPENLLGDFLDAVPQDRIGEAAEWIPAALSRAQREPVRRIAEIHQIRQDLRSADFSGALRPWHMGWRQAEAVRAHLGLDPKRRFDPAEYLSVTEIQAPDVRINAVGQQSRHGTSVVTGSVKGSSRTKKFLLGRAFWHSVGALDEHFLVTDAYTDKQKIERSFSAELLAPARGIAELLDVDPWAASPEDVDQIAEHFDVSPLLIEHQIENQLVESG
jgi:hypothetical protein